MEILKEKTIGEIVAGDYRAAAVFESLGIDFCCKGNKTIDEVCKSKGLDKEVVLNKLKDQLKAESDGFENYSAWPADQLAGHIEKKHHKYIEERTPLIRQYLDKICDVHGKQHPELFEIRDLFYEATGELATHMKKEELVLFPYIKRMVFAEKENSPLVKPHFGTVENPINMMRHEHDAEGELFRRMAELSGNFSPPEGACNTYRVAFSLLKEFEADLHLHIHLENNILFPKALEMEQGKNQEKMV